MKYFGSEEHKNNAKKASLLGLRQIEINRKGIVDDYLINPNKCSQCDDNLPYDKRNNKYCGSSCAATFNNKKRIVRDETKKLISEKLTGRKLSIEHISKMSGNKNSNWKDGRYKKLKQDIKKCVNCCF